MSEANFTYDDVYQINPELLLQRVEGAVEPQTAADAVQSVLHSNLPEIVGYFGYPEIQEDIAVDIARVVYSELFMVATAEQEANPDPAPDPASSPDRLAFKAPIISPRTSTSKLFSETRYVAQVTA
jgi:hypothetical protein